MRGRYLLAAALLLVVPTPARTDEEPRARGEAQEPLVFSNGDHRWVFDPSAFPFLRPEDRATAARLLRDLTGRGFQPTASTRPRLGLWEPQVGLPVVEGVVFPREWLDAIGEVRDLQVLIDNGGRFPAGYQPGGRVKPADLPPLEFLGAQVLLLIQDGQPQGRLTEVPEASRARKIGLRAGDAILGVNAEGVGARALLRFEEGAAAGRQQVLRVRRTHGEIERIVVDSWVRPPAGR